MTNVVVTVSHGDVAQALRRLKKKVGLEKVIVDLRNHAYYVRPGQKRRLKRVRAQIRARKLAAKSPRVWS